MKTVYGIIIGIALTVCIGASGTVQLFRPANPKEVTVKVVESSSDAQRFILQQCKKGFIVKSVTSSGEYHRQVLIVMEKY